jgi:hypothetical protein
MKKGIFKFLKKRKSKAIGKNNPKSYRTLSFIFVFLLISVLITITASFVLAFIGPIQNPPGGTGTLQVDSNGNFGIVSSQNEITPEENFFGKLFTISSNNNPGISIYNSLRSSAFTWYYNFDSQHNEDNLILRNTREGNGTDIFSISKLGSITSYGPIYSASNANYFIAPGLDGGAPYSATFAGSIGIGLPSPTSRLHVRGGDFRVDDSSNNPALFVQQSTGRVGLGTTAPSEKLQVNGGSVYTNAEGEGVIVDAGGSKRVGLMKYPGYEAMLIGNTSLPLPIRLGRWSGGTIKSPTTIYTDLVINPSGNVGIGMADPTEKLTVNGNIFLSSDGNSIKFYGGSRIEKTIGADIRFIPGYSGANFEFRNYGDTATNMIINPSGNVGIGTTNPSAKLHVYESALDKSGVLINIATTSASYYSLNVQSGGTSRLYVRADGNVGIGLSSPTSRLHVQGGDFRVDDSSNNPALFVQQSTGRVGLGTTGPSAKLDVFGSSGQINISSNLDSNPSQGSILGTLGFRNTYYSADSAYIKAITENTWSGGDYPTAIAFYTTADGSSSPSERLRIASNGNVMIGTTTATNYKLDVQGGQINASGGLCINGDCKTSWSQIQGTSYWALSGTNLYPTSTSYKVGIATTTPSYPLTVVGSVYISGSVYGGDYHSVANTNYYIDPAAMVMPYSAVFAGNVGIGTTTPSAMLHLQGNSGTIGLRLGLNTGQTAANSPMLMWDTTNMGGSRVYWMRQEGNDWIFRVSDTNYGNQYTIMAANTSGNVGIGTTSPTQKLSVNGAIDFVNTGGFSPTFGKPMIWSSYTGLNFSGYNYYFKNLGGANLLSISNTGGVALGSYAPSPPTDGLIISGNVGIGTTGPWQKLTVQNSNISSGNYDAIVLRGVLGGTTNVDAYMLVGNAYTGWGDSLTGLGIGTGTNHPLTLATNGGRRVTIDTSGNVGIGTTTPTYKLDVQGGQIRSSGGYCIGSISTSCISSWGDIQGTSYWTLSGTNLYPTSTSYKVGIATTTPPYPLTVAGSAYISGSVYGGDYHSVANTNYYIDPAAMVMPYSAVFAGNVGIGTTGPSDKLQIDTSMAFHSGGNKVIGFGWSPGSNQSLMSGYPAEIRWNPTNGTLSLGIDSTSRTAGQTPSISSLLTLTQDKVGVGTTTPATKLEVVSNTDIVRLGTIGNNQITGGRIGGSFGITAGSWTNGNLILAPNDAGTLYLNYGGGSGGIRIYDGGTSNQIVTIQSNGRVGIGTTSPGYKLSVVDTGTVPIINIWNNSATPQWTGVRFARGGSVDGTEKWFIGMSNSSDDLIFRNGGSSNYMTISSGNSPITVTIGDGGTNSKLNVGTVDPIYTIGGKRYATYLPSMTGVKEETTGVISLQKKNNNYWYYVIDFNTLKEGSDLWLFYHITDFGKYWDKLTVLLTPNFEGNIWYKKNPEEKKLIIYGNNKGEISYRLTAPRFDWKEWSNYSTSTEEGFNLDKIKK